MILSPRKIIAHPQHGWWISPQAGYHSSRMKLICCSLYSSSFPSWGFLNFHPQFAFVIGLGIFGETFIWFLDPQHLYLVVSYPWQFFPFVSLQIWLIFGTLELVYFSISKKSLVIIIVDLHPRVAHWFFLEGFLIPSEVPHEVWLLKSLVSCLVPHSEVLPLVVTRIPNGVSSTDDERSPHFRQCLILSSIWCSRSL